MEEKNVNVSGKPKKKDKKKKSFFTGLRTEWARIVWTPKAELVRQCIAVLAGSAALVLLISIIDSGALAILERIF